MVVVVVARAMGKMKAIGRRERLYDCEGEGLRLDRCSKTAMARVLLGLLGAGARIETYILVRG